MNRRWRSFEKLISLHIARERILRQTQGVGKWNELKFTFSKSNERGISPYDGEI